MTHSLLVTRPVINGSTKPVVLYTLYQLKGKRYERITPTSYVSFAIATAVYARRCIDITKNGGKFRISEVVW